eukprot:15337496-Ditylum_brightwellii.AAC.1
MGQTRHSSAMDINRKTHLSTHSIDTPGPTFLVIKEPQCTASRADVAIDIGASSGNIRPKWGRVSKERRKQIKQCHIVEPAKV